MRKVSSERSLERDLQQDTSGEISLSDLSSKRSLERYLQREISGERSRARDLWRDFSSERSLESDLARKTSGEISLSREGSLQQSPAPTFIIWLNGLGISAKNWAVVGIASTTVI